MHPAAGIHDHHVNVSKLVDLKKAVDNKLLVGYVYAAVTLIASDDCIVKPSPETVEALCLKHPAAPADIRQVPNSDIPYELDVSDTDIVEALKYFQPGSAGSVDDLRPGHLKDLTSSSTAEAGHSHIKAFASISTHVINGNALPIARFLIFAAHLTALRKKDGGIRPVADGNVMIRLASKMAAYRIVPIQRQVLPSVQLVVGVSGDARLLLTLSANLSIFSHSTKSTVPLL